MPSNSNEATGALHLEPGSHFTVLDGVALVVGAAIASVHMRQFVSERLTSFGWALVWITFAGIALTAAGLPVFLARRLGRRPVGYPKTGDWLWALLGLPWVVSAMVRPAEPRITQGVPLRSAEIASMQTYTGLLWTCIAVACVVSLVVLWRAWVMQPPEPIETLELSTWTERTGFILAVSWPVQCAFGLVVMG